MDKTLELLAPAGGMEQLTAAVENGADAVYMGGQVFNARIKAGNFSEIEFSEAISYAHLRNVKVYGTLNTLLTDEELLPALQYATRLYNMGVDALIIQDLGLASLIQAHLPALPLHLSTQGTVYNLSGVKSAKELGFSRVVLAREVSLEEIRLITKTNISDVEVFVHGALCVCYSGQCQMSRTLGGRSGNRGVCAQPCRLPYTDENGQIGFLLSPKDLCMIDHIAELGQAGVKSLKIEGRMKSPEYVGIVTSIYRKYIDLYYKNEHYTVSEEDRKTLAQIFNRGSFTTGYYFENPGKDLLSGELSKHQGLPIGHVVRNAERDLIDVELTDSLELGDGVEIHGHQLAGNVVTYMKKLGRGIVRIGDIKGEVRVGDPVYRITKISLMKDIRESYKRGRYHKKVPIEMYLNVKIGEHPELIVREGELHVQVVEDSFTAERAHSKPLTAELARRQLTKTGNTPFEVAVVNSYIQEESTLPMSALNKLRRKALQAFEGAKLASRQSAVIPKAINLDPVNTERQLAFYFFRGETISSYDFDKIMSALNVDHARAYVPLRFFVENDLDHSSLEVIPYILNISKGKLDAYIRGNLPAILERTRLSGIAIGNLGWIHEFRDADIKVFGDYGLNLFNKKSCSKIEELGVRAESLSHEAADGKDIPIMISEYMIPSKTITDRKNQAYKIVYNKEQDKDILFLKTKESDVKAIQERWKNHQGEMRIYIR